MRPLSRALIPALSSVLLVLAMGGLIRSAMGILELEPVLQAGHLPDDTFYYLGLARNFDTLGVWTFDGGVSRTSGFHLLHAYTLAGLHRVLAPNPDVFVNLAVLLSLTLTLAAVLCLLPAVVSSRVLFPALLVSLLLLSWNVQLNAVSAMEWGWVVLLSAAYCGALQRGRRYPRGVGGLLSMVCLGFLGAMARSDFGLLPAALAVAALIGRQLGWSAGYLGRSLAGLGGAGLGTLAVLAHGHVTSGNALQSSAQMKLLWSTDMAASAERLGFNLLSLFGPTSALTMVLAGALFLLVLLLGIGWLKGSTAQGKGAALAGGRTLWLGCLLAAVGYFIFYVRSADIQPWYTSTLIVPLGLFLTLPVVQPGWGGALRTGALLLLAGLYVDQVRSTSTYLATPTWPHHSSGYQTGHFLKTARLPGRIGCWNAGIIGYFQGGEVVNLDGLVNNDIYPYARDNRLPEYLQAKEIRFLVDYGVAFSPDKQIRGGFHRPDFIKRIRRIKTLARDKSGKGYLALYEILPKTAPAPGR